MRLDSMGHTEKTRKWEGIITDTFEERVKIRLTPGGNVEILMGYLNH